MIATPARIRGSSPHGLRAVRLAGSDITGGVLAHGRPDRPTTGPPGEVSGGSRLITYEEYHPFGTTSWWATDGGTEVSAKRYRYTGKERDDETGLGYHGARYYAAWLGRWERPDPAGMVDGPNRYAYCVCDPIDTSDPTGLAEYPGDAAVARQEDWHGLPELDYWASVNGELEEPSFATLGRDEAHLLELIERYGPYPMATLPSSPSVDWARAKWQIDAERQYDSMVARQTDPFFVALAGLFLQDAQAAHAQIVDLTGSGVPTEMLQVQRLLLGVLSDFERDPKLIVQHLSPNQLDAMVRTPRLAPLYTGSAIQAEFSERLLGTNLTSHNTGGNAPVDYIIDTSIGLKTVDITGASSRSVWAHAQREDLDYLAIYSFNTRPPVFQRLLQIASTTVVPSPVSPAPVTTRPTPQIRMVPGGRYPMQTGRR